ncbi:XRE family transcriptional regulator [Oxalobacteraceae bacterium R-40]|uniref:XRE family transcriptional regulator n=1 Tax=Keguizhuia sedimenti TaxID=3064264 RepID=A0ABU1BIG6_9BURK|nr:XRE family transcriptional regulator [Oxalobacteraceae bacterium R-40]
MTYEEFRRNVGKAGLTLNEFGRLMKMNPVSISNYGKRGVVPNHLAVIACLIGEMADHQIDYRSLLEKIDLDSKKHRGLPFNRAAASTVTTAN